MDNWTLPKSLILTFLENQNCPLKTYYSGLKIFVINIISCSNSSSGGSYPQVEVIEVIITEALSI